MYGIVDIGSNTMRLNIYKYENDEIVLMLSKKITAGLAGYVNDEGYLTSKGIDKAIDSLNELKHVLNNIELKKTYVFATASLRNIENSVEATRFIESKTGFDIRVLSGEEEGILDYVGASIKLNLDKGILIDIGGGSTELVIYKDEEVKTALSLSMGSLSLYNKYVKDFLPTKNEMKKIEKKILKELNKIRTQLPASNNETICGVGGTVRATYKLRNNLYDLKESNNTIMVKDINKILKYYSNNRHDFITHLIKNVPDRLHTILPGMIILYTIARYFNCDIINVSEYGIREGYLYQMIKNEGNNHVQ